MPIEVHGRHGLSYAILTAGDYSADEIGRDCRDATLDAGGGFTPQLKERVDSLGNVLVHKNGKPVGLRSFRWCSDTGREIELNPKLSSRHGQTPYMQVADIVESLMPLSTVACHMLEEGRKMLWVIKSDKKHVFGDGDEINEYFFVTSSLDSAWKTSIKGFAYRPQCTNVFKYGNLVFDSKNTTNNALRFSSWALKQAQRHQEWDEFVQNVMVLKQIEVPHGYFYETLQRIIPQPVKHPNQTERGHASAMTRWQTKSEAIWNHYRHERAEFGANMWALVQAIQSYELHDNSTSKSAEEKVIHGYDVVAGDKQPLTDKAFKILVPAV